MRIPLLGGFKIYRRRKGGDWSKLKGFPYYWVNRKPYSFEIGAGHVLDTERYE